MLSKYVPLYKMEIILSFKRNREGRREEQDEEKLRGKGLKDSFKNIEEQC